MDLEQSQVPLSTVAGPWLVSLNPCMYSPQGAFPARLKKVLIVGAPIWFRVPYSIISLLLKDKVRERVRQADFYFIWRWDRYITIYSADTCQLIFRLQKTFLACFLECFLLLLVHSLIFSVLFFTQFSTGCKFLEVRT